MVLEYQLLTGTIKKVYKIILWDNYNNIMKFTQSYDYNQQSILFLRSANKKTAGILNVLIII